ncbi:type II secretion system F family protein [Desulfatirhabdium butyrativorans]|uniref:type II secretion system F family protein n=1 Tax=Desulfatirhabdium butyrativorans TaxID=340467 RepID=UPI000407AC15|nr:type II secretion system F family protein [Desulfatirhabdium butyrativorans]
MSGRFRYEALDPAGKRIVESAEARSREDLLISLQLKGMVLLRWIDEERSGFRLPWQGGRRLSGKELLMFTRELAHLVKSGLAIDRALLILEQSSEAQSVQQMAKYLREAIQGGSSLSDAMARQEADFNELYVNMVRVGEMGGVLGPVLEKLAGFLERTEEIKRFVISSAIYPSILMSIGIVSVVVIMGFVVPKFAAIFTDMKQKIPASTMVLIQISAFLRAWWWALVLGIAGGVAGLWAWARTASGKAVIDRVSIRLPGLGGLLLDIQVSRFARTLGTLVQSGVPLLKALSIVRNVVSNILVKAASETIYREVKEGKRVSRLMKEQKVFPAMAVQMVALGEETGKIGEMLTSVADDLDTRIQAKIKSYLALLEPIAILLMGLIIGGVVISMLTAIFGLNDIEF